MKNDNYINYVLFGLGVVGVLYYLNSRKKRTIPVTEEQLVVAVQKEEEDKYSVPFREDYKIVMPSDLISKRLREKSAQLKEGRFAIQPDKVKAPLFL
jgi:hypothetical protein